MHGLVSILPPPYYQEVHALWKDLELRYGLQGIQITPYPHFSWQIAEDYDLERLSELMQAAARRLAPISIRTAGLGIFSGSRPVIFIPIVKDVALMELHARLWDDLGQAAQGLSPHYQPARWMPHISLAYEDVDRTNISPAIQWLSARPFAWEMAIDNLALIYEPAGSTGKLRYQYKFQGGGEET